jgi:hypothetical protein
MHILIDEEEIAKSYLSRKIYITEEQWDDQVQEKYYSSVFYEDEKINDAINLLSRYLEQDLVQQGRVKNGEICLRIIYYDYDYHETAGTFINVFSFGIGYLLGIPGAKSRTTVELETSIYDPKGELIANYHAFGKKSSFRGLYYRKIDERESNLIALKRALNDLNEQLMVDFEEINKTLVNPGI